MNPRRAILEAFGTVATLITLIVLCWSLTGCGTLPPPQTITRDIRIAAREAVRFAVRQEPNAKPYLQAAQAVLQATLNAQQYDPATLNGALAAISVKELRDQNVASLLSSALELYAAHFGDVVAGKLNPNTLKPVLEGLRDGIAEGLQ